MNIAIFQGLVIGFILLRSRLFKNETNQYLAFAILSLSWSLLNLVMDTTLVFDHYPFLKFIDIFDSAILFPTLIIFFVIHQVNHPKIKNKRLSWFFAPILLSIGHSIFQEISLSGKVFGESMFIDAVSDFLDLTLFLFTLFYLPYLLIKTYQLIQFSKIEQEKTWLTYLWLFEVIILMSWLIIVLAGLFIEEEVLSVGYYLALFASLLIHWVAYSGVYKFKLANEQKEIRALLLNRREPIRTNIASYHASQPETITTSQKRELVSPEPNKFSEENIYYKELERLCLDQKIYRDSTLDRNRVAEMLCISPSYVSQLINSITGENLSTYLNRYRVEDAKALLTDKEFESYSLLSIGLECGFTSKTTYYNWFKKITGMTPSAYRKANK